MPIDASTLPSTMWVEIDGIEEELPVYSDEDAYANDSYEGRAIVPAENLVKEWTGYQPGDITVFGKEAAGGRAPGARIGMIAPSHATYDTNDLRSYEGAYEDVMGYKAPGSITFLIAIALILIATLIWYYLARQADIDLYAIEKEHEVQVIPLFDQDGTPSDWQMTCVGDTCGYFNTVTGKFATGPEGDFDYEGGLAAIGKYAIIIVGVAIVGYVAIKLIGGSMATRRMGA